MFKSLTAYIRYTRIIYNPFNSTLTFDRTTSTLAPNFTTTNYHNFFEPYRFSSIDGSNTITTEALNFDIFVDGSLVEIFINNRFAFTGRVYPTRADALGIALFSENTSTAQFDDIIVWTDMLNVWPQRPLNSSSPLHYDPYYETHITYENIFDMPIGLKLYDGF